MRHVFFLLLSFVVFKSAASKLLGGLSNMRHYLLATSNLTMKALPDCGACHAPPSQVTKQICACCCCCCCCLISMAAQHDCAFSRRLPRPLRHRRILNVAYAESGRRNTRRKPGKSFSDNIVIISSGNNNKSEIFRTTLLAVACYRHPLERIPTKPDTPHLSHSLNLSLSRLSGKPSLP